MENHPARLELPAAHMRALTWLVITINPDRALWVLSGSASLRLHGVEVPVHDLDILTDQQNIALFEQRLAVHMTDPVHLWESPGMRSLDGKAEFEGIQIELLANVSHKMPDGSWRGLTDFSRIEWFITQGLRVATFPLEDELAAYIAMDREEKVALIRKTIKALSDR